MLVSAFDYYLPESSIAQAPLEDRAASRMLVLHRAGRRWEDRMFRDFPQFLSAGDCLAVNDSKVFPARLLGRRRAPHTGPVEVFLLRPVSGDGKTWSALVRPGRKMPIGETVYFDGIEAQVLARGESGERTLRFDSPGDFHQTLNRIGHVPLPPYIRRPDSAADRERYQTVFAQHLGSAAAPTAGLHFTPEILDRCRATGAGIARVTLHIGLGTFQPLRATEVEAVQLHPEAFSIREPDLALLRAASRRVAVGTTSVRSLESAWQGRTAETDLFIYPGFEFLATGAILTNFHLPKSSLLMLVCAFAGREFVLDAYRHAVAAGYRFFSYGDAMLIV